MHPRARNRSRAWARSSSSESINGTRRWMRRFLTSSSSRPRYGRSVTFGRMTARSTWCMAGASQVRSVPQSSRRRPRRLPAARKARTSSTLRPTQLNSTRMGPRAGISAGGRDGARGIAGCCLSGARCCTNPLRPSRRRRAAAKAQSRRDAVRASIAAADGAVSAAARDDAPGHDGRLPRAENKSAVCERVPILPRAIGGADPDRGHGFFLRHRT
jgi:hypothetical protein